MRQELAEEMRQHLEERAEELMGQGVPREEAEYQAKREFGNMTHIEERSREAWMWPLIESVWADVKFAVRQLRKSPGFSVTAMLVIALGIGANVALFTVVRSVLLRPLPFARPDRLVEISGLSNAADRGSRKFVAAGDFFDWQKSAHSFEQMSIWRYSGFNVSGDTGELPEFVDSITGSWNMFATLGVQPVLGRSFAPNDDRQGATPTTILTWNFFQRRFNGDAQIVGKSVRLNGKPYLVLGVMPKWFAFPDAKVALWVPLQVEMPQWLVTSHFSHSFHVVARLSPGFTAAGASQEVDGLQQRIFASLHVKGPVEEGAVADPLIDGLVGDVRTPLRVLMAAVGCLLLIACMNVSNLLLARAAARRREIAIRGALGSSRARLIRGQVIESVLICLAGALPGLALAAAATRWLATHWAQMPRAEAIQPDSFVAGFAVGITLLTGVVAGLTPAVAATGRDLVTALKDSSRNAGGSVSRASLRKTILTAEIALTVLLLICAGLLLKSFLRLRSVDLGCTTKNVLTMQYFLRGDKYTKPEQIAAFHTQVLERVRALPGVDGAGLVSVVPGNGIYGDTTFTIREHPARAQGDFQSAQFRAADPGYFAAMQIPILQGRSFSEDEWLDHDRYLIVSQNFVREFLGREDPLGKHVRVAWRSPEGEDYEIIGVVGDTLYQAGKPSKPMMYFPMLSGIWSTSEAALAVRSRKDVVALAIPIQKTIASIDPELPVTRVLTMEQIVGESTANSSFSATLVLVFAGISLMLASIGLYGVLAYLVSQRTTEIGIRMALGAQRATVLQRILLDGMRPAIAGLILGVALSVAATRWIGAVLYATQPLDPAVIATVAAAMLFTSIAACLIPARRAASIDPMQALRAE